MWIKQYLMTKTIYEQVDAYLIKNPIETGKAGCYAGVAKEFNVSSEYVRDRYRKLVKRGKLKDLNEVALDRAFKTSFKENVKTGEADLTQVVNRRIKTLEDLIDACEIDTKVWEVTGYECNKWEVGRKDKTVDLEWQKGVATGRVKDTGKIHVEPLFQVKVKLSRRKVDKDLGLQKEAVIEEIKAYMKSPFDPAKILKKYGLAANQFAAGKKNCALEINVPDLHLGKLAWGEETGDNYDIKIAVERYKNAVAELISRTNISEIEKFILVVGHDFLNVDAKNNMTTAGTVQSSDVRFYKMVKIGKQLLIDTIDELSLLAPVDVVVVPGNHDTNSMLMMGDILLAFYHNSKVVNVFNDPAPRKYYRYGQTGLMYTHGHSEKIDDLGIIFATENKQLWAETAFHRVHLGHFHHQKQIRFKDVQEQVGCTIKIISSLSSNDAWHTEKGYLSLKGAEAFLYHRDHGLLANYHYFL